METVFTKILWHRSIIYKRQQDDPRTTSQLSDSDPPLNTNLYNQAAEFI